MRGGRPSGGGGGGGEGGRSSEPRRSRHIIGAACSRFLCPYLAGIACGVDCGRDFRGLSRNPARCRLAALRELVAVTVERLTSSENQVAARAVVRAIVRAFEAVASSDSPWHLDADVQESLMADIDAVDPNCSTANAEFELWVQRNASVYRMYLLVFLKYQCL